MKRLSKTTDELKRYSSYFSLLSTGRSARGSRKRCQAYSRIPSEARRLSLEKGKFLQVNKSTLLGKSSSK